MTELFKRTAAEVVELVRTRRASAQEVARSVLDRLAAVNPAINAVVQEMPDQALAAARAVDEAVAAGRDPGLLAGVPVTVKVNVDQAGFATTNGLRIQKDLVAEHDSPVVANLKRAGAVIVGRTNTPAFSLRWFTRNSLHGHTLNARNPAITPGGSSGGAASATVAGIGCIGHGTDIGGSVRYPAYACGIHGLRPTLGRVPAVNLSGPDRHIGAQLMAVSGPMARTVDDVWLGFAAMAAADHRDPWWVPVPLEMPAGARRVALAVAPDGLDVEPAVAEALADAAARLTDAGYEVAETECPGFREAAHLQAILWLAESRRYGNQALKDEDDPDANIVFARMEQLCPESAIDHVLDAMQKRVGLIREWQVFLEDWPLVLCPVSARLPFADLEDVRAPGSFDAVLEAQLTQVGLPLLGLPGLTVSTAMAGDVPVGVQLVGRRYHEKDLIEAGRSIERAGMPPSPVDPAV